MSAIYVNPKHEDIHKLLALCLFYWHRFGSFSAVQAEYSAYAYSIHKTAVQPQQLALNTSKTTPQRTRKEKLKISWLNIRNYKITWAKETTKYIKIIIIDGKDRTSRVKHRLIVFPRQIVWAFPRVYRGVWKAL